MTAQQMKLVFPSHDGVETCRACGATSKCHLFELDRTQIELLESAHARPGRFGNEAAFTAHVCKSCLRRLRKAGLDPAITAYEWTPIVE